MKLILGSNVLQYKNVNIVTPERFSEALIYLIVISLLNLLGMYVVVRSLKAIKLHFLFQSVHI